MNRSQVALLDTIHELLHRDLMSAGQQVRNEKFAENIIKENYWTGRRVQAERTIQQVEGLKRVVMKGKP